MWSVSAVSVQRYTQSVSVLVNHKMVVLALSVDLVFIVQCALGRARNLGVQPGLILSC